MANENRIIINTPCGLRYIDVPDYQEETLWDAVAKYDDANNTDLGDRLNIDDIVAAGQESSAYSCSPLSFPEDFGEPVTEWTGTKKIGLHGSSLSVAITEACRILGLEKGDVVEVTIRRKD